MPRNIIQNFILVKKRLLVAGLDCMIYSSVGALFNLGDAKNFCPVVQITQGAYDPLGHLPVLYILLTEILPSLTFLKNFPTQPQFLKCSLDRF